MIPIFATAAAVAFNLSCAISSIGFMGEMPKKPDAPLTALFRVDLTSRRYCEGDCRSTEPIAKVTATDLYLKMTDEPRLKEFLRINRESGDMLSIWRLGSTSANSTEMATCTPSQFTGFPSRKF